MRAHGLPCGATGCRIADSVTEMAMAHAKLNSQARADPVYRGIVIVRMSARLPAEARKPSASSTAWAGSARHARRNDHDGLTTPRRRRGLRC